MFRNSVDLEIWEYNTCRLCIKNMNCPVQKELRDTGQAPEVEPVGLGWTCHAMERKNNG